MSSPRDQNEGIQQPKQKFPCANNCGFFANEACLGLCSKCHEERMKHTRDGTPHLTDSNSKTQIPPLKPNSNSLESGSSSFSTVSSTLVPPRVKRVRCAECHKKVGLNGFKCKCGGIYCGDHRHVGGHVCKFDHKATVREHLTRQNPVIQGEKLDRLL